MNIDPFLRSSGKMLKAYAANDAAVLRAYGWPTDLSGSEIVSRLFALYAKLISGGVA